MSLVDKILMPVKVIAPDEYDLKARWLPTLASLLPAVLVAAASISEIADGKFGTGPIGGAVLLIVQFVGMWIVRAVGKSRQAALFKAWGGTPTTAMLRHRDDRLNPHTKLRLHDQLRRLGPGFVIPTAAEEMDDPAAADLLYEAAVYELRKRVKATGIKPVHRENIGYGGARNFYGIKSFGLFMCAASLLVLGVEIWRQDFGTAPGEIGAAFAIIIIAIAWVFGCRSGMVKIHAESYAYALFEAADHVIPQETAPRKRKQKEGSLT